MEGSPSTVPTPRDHGPLMTAVGLAALLVLVRVVSPGIPDSGDGVAHFQHARYCWSEPEAALSQWGKPVFSLLGSPFTALGGWGLTAFTALCAVAACAVIIALLRRERYGLWAWAAPLLLFFVPVYAHTVLAGLTEPLFGTLAVLIVLLLWRAQHAAAMALLSVLPFVRPEYAAFAPFAIGVVMRRKAWRALPWALLGTVLYVIACGLLLGKPWDFFTQHTYAGKDTYGPGDPWHFVLRLDEIYGRPFLRVWALALVAFFVLFVREPEHRTPRITMAVLTLAPALGIIALHSYAYSNGTMASLGLLRVLATTAPLLVLFIVYTLAGAWALFVPDRTWTRACFAALVLLHGNMAFHELREREQMPVAEDEIQHTVREAAKWLRAHRAEGQRVVCEDPLIAALCEVDPWDSAVVLRLRGITFMERKGIQGGDHVVWEAHFAPNEGGTSLDTLLHDGRYEEDTVLLPRWPMTVLGDRPYSIHVFHRIAGDWARSDSALFDLSRPDAGVASEHAGRTDSSGVCHFAAEEFPLTLVQLPVGATGHAREVLVARLRLLGEPPPGHKLQLVLEQVDSTGTRSFENAAVGAGEQTIRLTVHPGADPARTKLYLWNTSGQAFLLDRFTVTREGLRRVAGRRKGAEHRSSPR